MIPLDNLATVAESCGPAGDYALQPVPRSGNRWFRRAGVQLGPGRDGDGGPCQEIMMPGMTYEWTGLTLDEIESGGKALIIFGLGMVVVYLTLSAQYESFALPFIILLAVPMAVLGALGACRCAGCRTMCTARSAW